MSKAIDFPSFLFQIGVISEESLAAIGVSNDSRDVLSCVSFLKDNIGIESSTVDYYVSEWQHMPTTLLDDIDPKCVVEIPEKTARRYAVIVFSKDDHGFLVASSNPYDEAMLTDLHQTLHGSYQLYMAPKEKITAALNRYFRKTRNIEHFAEKAKTNVFAKSAHKIELDGIDRIDSKASVVNLLDYILQDAIQVGATDIHIESNFSHLIYYYRVGHDSSEKISLPVEISDMLVQRLLILGDGDISQRKKPQDLSFSFMNKLLGQKINVRLSVLFTQTGYSVVMRLLLSETDIYPLEDLLKDKRSFDIVSDFLRGEHGMMLVTGPTASGKTTLLYTLLKKVHGGNKKIISIEDPIEIQYSHLNQVQVNADVGLDFQDVIRSSLRQNPDVLMVGEIRDQVTATMSMRGAMTGVLVFSTLHTANTIKTVTRLVDLGVDPFLIGSSLRLVLATRLLRKTCVACSKKSRALTEEERRILKNHIEDKVSPSIQEAIGCDVCQHTGTQGLIMIVEALRLNPSMQEAIARADIASFEQQALDDLRGHCLMNQAKQLFDDGVIPVDQFIKLVSDS